RHVSAHRPSRRRGMNHEPVLSRRAFTQNWGLDRYQCPRPHDPSWLSTNSFAVSITTPNSRFTYRRLSVLVVFGSRVTRVLRFVSIALAARTKGWSSPSTCSRHSRTFAPLSDGGDNLFTRSRRRRSSSSLLEAD